MIVNTQQIDPMPVITGAAEYPEQILDQVEKAGADTVRIDALGKAMEAGSVKAVNMVLLGVLAAGTDIPEEDWLEAVRRTVPEKFVEMNLKAFGMGYHS